MIIFLTEAHTKQDGGALVVFFVADSHDSSSWVAIKMKQYLTEEIMDDGLKSHIVTQTCEKSVIPSQLTADLLLLLLLSQVLISFLLRYFSSFSFKWHSRFLLSFYPGVLGFRCATGARQGGQSKQTS